MGSKRAGWRWCLVCCHLTSWMSHLETVQHEWRCGCQTVSLVFPLTIYGQLHAKRQESSIILTYNVDAPVAVPRPSESTRSSTYKLDTVTGIGHWPLTLSQIVECVSWHLTLTACQQNLTACQQNLDFLFGCACAHFYRNDCVHTFFISILLPN